MTKVVFFGTEHESSLVLEKLIKNNFDISLVVTKPDSLRGRGQKIQSPDVKKLASKYNIPVAQPNNLEELSLPNDSSVGVLVSYGKIIPQSIIDSFANGIINIHPSMLPKYRGPSPVESTILNGDNETGVSIMSLEAGMDSGSIYVQEKITLDQTETYTGLLEKLMGLGADLLIENFEKIISGKLTPTKQNDPEATYCKLIQKVDGVLNPTTMTAIECERKVRAFASYPKTRINFQGNEVIVIKAKILNSFAGDEWPDVIKCENNSYLQIEQIISPKSGKTMDITDYMRGL